jgi:hypothetical protein
MMRSRLIPFMSRALTLGRRCRWGRPPPLSSSEVYIAPSVSGGW